MQVKQEDLNLIPIMGVMIILIPVVLFTYSFDQLKVQQVATPRVGATVAGAAAKEDAKVPLKLAVHIGNDGFKIKVNEVFTDLAFPEIPKAKFQVSFKPGSAAQPVTEYDYPRLYSVLRGLKDQERFKEEDSIDISAEMNVPWSVVAATIDAARVKLVTADFSTTPNYEQALELYRRDKPVMEPGARKDKDGKVLLDPVLMFPKVVFTVAEVVN
jgi:biopolymer transport protein ExbD